jgi:GT2 family glycosyltransferase
VDRRAPIGDPVASVVVLTYDRPASLARCLESLIAQRLELPIEIIVADDGSGPATAEVVRAAQQRDRRIRHVRHQHRGIPATRNLGVRAARGRRVAIVADDYVLSPDYLSRALAYLDAHPSAAVVRSDIRPLTTSWGARTSHVYYSASILRRLASEGISAVDATNGVVTSILEAAGAAVFRAEVLAAVGPWDESLQRGEDTEHTERLRAAGFEVHLLAAGTVRHHYRAVPVDTLKKNFVTAINRARLAPEHGPWTAGKLKDLSQALGRARLAGDSWFVIALYLPPMLAFEIATYAGVIVGRLQVWSGRRRVRTRFNRMPDSSVR